MDVTQASHLTNKTWEDADYEWSSTPKDPSTSSFSNNDISENNYGMSWWIQFGWTLIFAFMITVACVGNCIVIWIVIGHRRMRTVTNYFLVNLSTADLLLTLLNCGFNFIYMIQRHWPFGSWYCSISNFIANSTVAASVFTLTGISCDRYLAIVHPLKPRMSKTSSLFAITIFWTASFVFALPCLLYSTTITNSYKGKQTTGCILMWPDGKLVGSKFDFIYQMLFLILTYIVPITLMIFCYSMMGRVLWGSQYIGELSERHIESIKSKRKVVKMFILMVLIFGICWLPYHAYFLYVYYDTNVIFSKYTQHVYLAFYWFAMSNAMVNPLIYYFMNTRFRRYFKSVICWWHHCSKRKGIENSPTYFKDESHSYQCGHDNISRRCRKKEDNIECFTNGTSLKRQSTIVSNVRMSTKANHSKKWIRANKNRRKCEKDTDLV